MQPKTPAMKPAVVHDYVKGSVHWSLLIPFVGSLVGALL